jgi:hypothetical protein
MCRKVEPATQREAERAGDLEWQPAVLICCVVPTSEDQAMAKGQQRQPKEKKKPKADANKTKVASGYKASYSTGKK